MNVDFNIINQKGSPAIFSDTYANRPAASYPGRLFISTDTKEIYRDTGTAWEEIAGSGSGNIQGSGTANYVPKFTDTETIGNSQIRDDGTGVGIGVAPSAVYKLDISGSQRNTLAAAGGLSIVQSGVLEASYGVYNSSSGAAFLFEKFDDATATFTDSGIYALGGFYTKVSDGTSNFYNSFFANGNVAFNSVVDSGQKLQVNGSAIIQTLTVGLGGGSVIGNTAVGFEAGFSNTSATGITAIGYQALRLCTGINNTALGNSALLANTTGITNSAIGVTACRNNITGNSNSAIGYQALYNNTSGSSNTAIGQSALESNTASNNTAVGFEAALTNTSGTGVTAVGYQALRLSTGAQNTAFGLTCLSDNTTGIDNTSIGAATSSGNFSGSLILGRNATATASNQCVFGSAGTNAGTVAAAVTAQANVWNVVINGTARQILLA